MLSCHRYFACTARSLAVTMALTTLAREQNKQALFRKFLKRFVEHFGDSQDRYSKYAICSERWLD